MGRFVLLLAVVSGCAMVHPGAQQPGDDDNQSPDAATNSDHAPTAPGVSVPAHVSPNTPIPCTVTTPSTDPDGDAITYTASWTKNGQPFTGATSTATITNDTSLGGAQNDVFVCTITASDGTLTASGSATATVDCTSSGATPMTFSFTGSSQTYVVGTCVHSLLIEVTGAGGAGTHPGIGGKATATYTPTPGETLTIYVGGANGYNGGGTGSAAANVANGGGASDVRKGAATLADRIIVAGGGGGGITGDVGSYTGGAGGGGTCGANYCGGAGAAGYGGTSAAGGQAGGAGTSAGHGGSGGGGGLNSGGTGACDTIYMPMQCGTAGALGIGGNGGNAQQQGSGACYSTYGGTAGGGGGYYGGGGSAVGYCGGGAGGGGSSWTGTLASPTFAAGTTGNGSVKITPQ